MDPAKLISTIFRVRASQYVSVAGATLYFYDYFLTLGSEVDLFWTSKGGWLIRVLVIIIRYFPMIGFPIALLGYNPLVLSPSIYVCRISSIGAVLFQITCCMATTAIFCLRVCILYDRYSRIRQFIFAVLWICIAAQIITTSIALSMTIPRIGTIDGRCAMVKPTPPHQAMVVSLAYIAEAPCEVVLILATVYHGINTRKVISNSVTVWPILRHLYTDGAFWFMIGLCFRLWGCLQWLLCPEDLKYLSDHLIYGLQTIVAGRFFLAFRKHIGDLNSSTANVVHVSPSGKAAVGLGMESSSFSSLGSMHFKRGEDDRHIVTSITSVHYPRKGHAGFPSINTTTQDGRST